MEEFLPPWASLLTFPGLAGFVALSFIRGWIIPKATVAEIVKQKDRAIDDRDAIIRELRAQNVALDRRNDLLAAQVHQLVSSGYINATAGEIVDAETYPTDDPQRGAPGIGDSASPAGAPPRGGQAARYGKTRDRGSPRRKGR